MANTWLFDQVQVNIGTSLYIYAYLTQLSFTLKWRMIPDIVFIHKHHFQREILRPLLANEADFLTCSLHIMDTFFWCLEGILVLGKHMDHGQQLIL